MNATETTEIIQRLIEVCRDGEEGFRLASEETGNADLKRLFMICAGQWEQFAAELREIGRRFGDVNAGEGGSLGGALHRGWMNLKAAVIQMDERAVLAECERGQELARSAYSKALQEDLPPELREAVQRQFEQVTGMHDRMRALREARED